MSSDPSIVGGIYEAVFAVPDLIEGIRYWQRFGYRVARSGRINSAASRALYGVDADLESVRLGHQTSDHGLVRLMSWRQRLGPGLAQAPFRGLGSRWVGTKTLNMTRLFDHVELARAKGGPITGVAPFFVPFAPPDRLQPFLEPIAGVREMTVMEPYWRRVFIELVGYEMPAYGQIDRQSLFETSQFTHVCLVHQDDLRKALTFYDQVLGMKRASEAEAVGDRAVGGKKIFDLAPGENFHVIDFDDPRSGDTLATRRSGRLKIIRFLEGRSVADRRQLSGPGNLGLVLYTALVRPIAEMHEKVRGSTGEVGGIVTDEFGAPAFRCVAPDGYAWVLIAA